MRKSIKYFESYFGPDTHEYDYGKGREFTVTVNTQEEFDAVMTAVTNPSRGILSDSITVEDLPDTPDEITIEQRLEACEVAIMELAGTRQGFVH